MSILNAALDTLLDNLTQLLKYNYHLVADVGDIFLALHDELRSLKAVLDDYSNYYKDNDFIKALWGEIRAIVDQAEDAVDTFVFRAAVQRSKSFVSKAYYRLADYPQVLREVNKRIEDVRHKVKTINREKEKLGFEGLPYLAIESTKEAPRVEEEHVVGFDRSTEELTELLTRGPEELKVISIVGMLGIGKTTLAKKVFNQPDIDFEYTIRSFVYVTQEYKRREVYLKILSSFTQISDEVRQMPEEILGNYLHQQLEGKQYLVVLDDVWEAEVWDKLKDAFPNNRKRCRVLITTRNARVAEGANPENPNSFHKLDFLSFQESRELLRWKVFRENHCPAVLQEYEMQIVRNCDGLPLSIVVVAGILWNNLDRVDWWKNVANTTNDYIARDQNETGKVIEVMYAYLPNHLKPCFLYLGVFPDYFQIPIWKLIRLWIAEGLIQPNGDLNLEDIAEKYLEELVYRNLVVVGQRRSNGKIKTCLLQSTLCEFCKREAMEENLFQEIKQDKLSFFLSGNPSLDQYRRICINNVNILDYISGRPSGKSVRSFLTFAREETIIEPKLVSCIPKTFKLLKVLEIESLIFTRFPSDLRNVVLLKYLALSSHFSSVPPALSSLWSMQTLIVNTTSSSLEIKADIWKMPHFRHLHTNVSTILPLPDGKHKKGKQDALVGKTFQTLSTISPESCKKEVFDQTPELKKLSIRGSIVKLFEDSSESSLFGYLQSLNLLEKLKLLNEEGSPRLDKLPSEKSFPPLLRSLTLSKTQLDWEEMCKLEMLGNLEVLKLKDNAFQGNSWQSKEGCFQSLKHLHIGRTDLVVWQDSANNFPKLTSLALHYCDKLEGIPASFAYIPCLQSVILHCTNPQVSASARNIQTLKLKQAKNDNENSSFKLSVYPPGC